MGGVYILKNYKTPKFSLKLTLVYKLGFISKTNYVRRQNMCSLFYWTFAWLIAFLPCVTLCFGNVTKNMSKGVWDYPSEFRHCSHTLHGECFSCASLPVCKNSAWNGQQSIKSQFHFQYILWRFETNLLLVFIILVNNESTHLRIRLNRGKSVCLSVCVEMPPKVDLTLVNTDDAHFTAIIYFSK